MSETENLDEAYAMAKLRPAETGLPMAVWVIENDGFPHDVRVNRTVIIDYRDGKLSLTELLAQLQRLP